LKEEQNITQGIKKGIAKAILWVFLILFFSLSVIVLAMQSSAVQTKVAQYGSDYFSEKLGFEISIERINIEWFDQITLSGLYVKNKDQSTFIDIQSLWINYDIKQLINDKSVLFDNLRLEDGRVMLIRKKNDDYFNIDYLVEAIRNLSAPKNDSSSNAAKNLLIREASLSNIILGVANLDTDSIKEGFNYNQFVLHNLNADLKNFSSRADTIQMQVERLSAVDSVTDLTIHNLNSNFEISQSRLSLTDLKLEVNKSTIADSIVFNYNSISNLSHIIDSVTIKANLKNSIIFTEDLALFAPYLNRYEDNINVSGKFNGKVKRFKAQDLRLQFGNSSFITGDLKIDGLPRFSESFIDLNLTNSSLVPSDLKQYINDSIAFQRISTFGITNFQGSFIGFPADFVANGVFTSPLGRVESDLNLKIGQDSKSSTYKGSLSTYNFNLGKFLDEDSIFQKLQMTGNIQGSGFTLETAKLNLNAKINLVGINGYEYQNISTNTELSSEFFNGNLSINDPLLKFKMDGSIDLRENKKLINVTADLDTINFKKLNITKDDFILAAEGNLDGRGITLDSIEGNTSLQKIYAAYQGNSLQLDSLTINTSNKNGLRKLKINSDLFRAKIDGNYQFTQLQKDLMRTVKEYQLNIENDKNKIENYYNTIDTTVNLDDYTVNFDFFIKEINPLISLVLPKLHVKKGAVIKGQFQNGKNSNIYVESSIDSINYGGYSFSKSNIDLNFSKFHLSQDVLGIGFITSEQQQLNNNIQSKNLEIEFYWTGREINFSTYLDQDQSENHFNIKGNLAFLDDTLNLAIQKSDITLFSKKWRFLNKNNLKISDQKYTFENFGIYSEDEQIIANGELSKDSTRTLLIEIDSFNIENINYLVEEHDFKGTANGFVEIQKYQDEFLLTTELSLVQFYLDEFLIGNINGFSNWQPNEEKLLMDYIVSRKNEEIIKLEGAYTPSMKQNSLDLKARLKKTNLVIVEPFINTIFSEMRGEVDGEFQITGNPERPIVNGTGKITNGGIKINYLNTYYDYTGNINFNQEKVTFENIQLTDEQGNNGFITGDLLHDGFTDLRLDLFGQMNNLKVLNTSARDNELYYGSAFVTGNVTFSGSVGNLTIDAQAKSEKGTRIFIPVESTSSIEQEDYINFININDTTNNKIINKVEEVDIKGITMNFDLELTPDAYAEIIFDIKSGDIIRGRGNGKLSMNIDTNGAFTMIGDYTLTEGGYNFTLYNIINKEFSIQPGSQISWDGDPYQANLDIQAVYEQNVSLSPIVDIGQDSTLADSPELKRRYPAKVLLDLKGDLLKPEVDFDINFSNYPDQIYTEAGTSFPLRTSVTAFEAELEANEQELKRQVFSLIILRRLSPRASFAVSGSVGNSVSEFLSNQLSYWVTQIDENLEIDVDLGSFDEDEFNTFQLRLSYSFLGGRLRITRDGGFTQGETDNVNQEILGILGDWSVEYLLTPDGKLRAKIYNRTNFNALDQVTNTATTSTGVSLVHVTSFDQIKEIFEKNKKKKKDKSEDKKEEKPQEINSDAVLREEDENSK